MIRRSLLRSTVPFLALALIVSAFVEAQHAVSRVPRRPMRMVPSCRFRPPRRPALRDRRCKNRR